MYRESGVEEIRLVNPIDWKNKEKENKKEFYTIYKLEGKFIYKDM